VPTTCPYLPFLDACSSSEPLFCILKIPDVNTGGRDSDQTGLQKERRPSQDKRERRQGIEDSGPCLSIHSICNLCYLLPPCLPLYLSLSMIPHLRRLPPANISCSISLASRACLTALPPSPPPYLPALPTPHASPPLVTHPHLPRHYHWYNVRCGIYILRGSGTTTHALYLDAFTL